MTSSHGNIFRVTGPLCGNSPVTGEFLSQGQWRGVWCFLWSTMNQRLSKQSWGWWFERPLRPLWRNCNVCDIVLWCTFYMEVSLSTLMTVLFYQRWLKQQICNWLTHPNYMTGNIVSLVLLWVKYTSLQPAQRFMYSMLFQATYVCELSGTNDKTGWVLLISNSGMIGVRNPVWFMASMKIWHDRLPITINSVSISTWWYFHSGISDIIIQVYINKRPSHPTHTYT